MVVKQAHFITGLLLIWLLGVGGCAGKVEPKPVFKGSKAVLIIVDGVRYTDAYTDSAVVNFPSIKEVYQRGTRCTNFFNDGVTNTVNGLAALCTGHYEMLTNGGLDTPSYSTFLHYWLKQTGQPSYKACLFSSKAKIGALAGAGDVPNIPYVNAMDSNSSFRSDSVTFALTKSYALEQNPDLIVLHFAEPDLSGHTGNYENYIEAIHTISDYALEFVNTLEATPYYKNKTNYFITNDHGRHSDGVANFKDHGDKCHGCRHINLMAIGPDITSKKVINTNYSQIDIAATISYLMGANSLEMYNGKVMKDLLQ